MKHVAIILLASSICMTAQTYAQSDSFTTVVQTTSLSSNLNELPSNFPSMMEEIANGDMDEAIYPRELDIQISPFDYLSDESCFGTKNQFTVHGKQGSSSYGLMYMEAIYSRDISAKSIYNDGKLLLHAKTPDGNYIDIMMFPQKFKVKGTNSLIITDQNSSYTLYFPNDELCKIFQREITTYINVVKTLKKDI